MTFLERNEFQRLLFRTSFCLMACDGYIDEREVEEIKKMNKESHYFQGIDLSEELNDLLNDLKEKGRLIVNQLFQSLSNIKLSTVQELLILEVSFRLINADEKVDENEIKFLRLLRSKLKLHDEIIRDRFGAVEYLFDKDYSHDIAKSGTYSDFLSTIFIPEIKEIQTIDFSSYKDEK